MANRNEPTAGPDGDAGSAGDVVLAEILAGDSTSWPGALEAACRAHPHLSDELQTRFDALASAGLLGALAEPSDPGADEESGTAGEPGSAEEPGAMAAAGLDTPDRFGDFLLGDVLGKGGMGVVHRAYQIGLDREVALKLIRPDYAVMESSKVRFRREAEAAARLSHPSIVPVFVSGEHEGVPFFAMEAVEGGDLATLIAGARTGTERRTGEALAPCLAGQSWNDAIVGLGVQLASALEHAHGASVLHRDIKPSNVLVAQADGRARLVDFGLSALRAGPSTEDEGPQVGEPWTTESKAGDQPSTRLTRAGTAAGTLLYMAPEHLQRGAYDERGEIYSLGATLYECLALEPPFKAETREQTEALVLEGRPRALRSLNRSVRSDVEAVVMKAIARAPEDRYPSMGALRDDLQRAVERRPVEARAGGVGYRLQRWVAREPWFAASLGVLAIGAALVPALFFLREADHSASLEKLLESEKEMRAASQDMTLFALDALDERDPNMATDVDRSRRVALETEGRIERLLAKQPAYAALLRTSVARIQASLGNLDESERLLLESIAVLDVELETDLVQDDVQRTKFLNAGLAEAHSRLAMIYDLRGDTVQLEREAATLAELLAGLHGESSWQAVLAQANLMRTRSLTGSGASMDAVAERGAAIQALTDAVAQMEKGAPVFDRARALGLLGSFELDTAMTKLGDERTHGARRAREPLSAAIVLFDSCGRGESLDRAQVALLLGVACKMTKDFDAAQGHMAEGLAVLQQRLAPTDYRIGGALVNAAALADAKGDLKSAKGLYERAVSNLEAALPTGHASAVTAAGSYASVLFRLQEYAGLRERFERLIPLQEATFGESHWSVGVSRERYGILLFGEKKHAPAIEQFKAARAIYVERKGADDPNAKRIGDMLAILEKNAPR